MNVSMNSLGDFGLGKNEGAVDGYRSLSKDDIFDQTRYVSYTNEYENWQLNSEQGECNTYIEEYE